ncbi:unnamed protein product [Calicophoron daubneyi]|uniref:RING-type E3 ubiquitin transferase n=1 Tax=Calicophoron daubneyi TaxID=300641 RepID=A0AAV2T196_CALDB
MGSRLSLDSSESESSGPTGSTTQASSNYFNRGSTSNAVTTGASLSQSGTARNGPAEAPSSIDDILRELGHNFFTTTDEEGFLRLFCSRRTPGSITETNTDLTSRRSNSVTNRDASEEGRAASSADHLGAVSRQSTRTTRPRHRRHRSSWLGPDGAEATTSRGRGRNPRRSEPFDHGTELWGSSGSDSDSDMVDSLRLSSIMLRHFNLNEASNHDRQASDTGAENDLIRALRLSAARVTYNVDRLTRNEGECPICLEDLSEGDVIARLPCLCIYHKKCIDSWFRRRPVCPVHPGINEV